MKGVNSLSGQVASPVLVRVGMPFFGARRRPELRASWPPSLMPEIRPTMLGRELRAMLGRWLRVGVISMGGKRVESGPPVARVTVSGYPAFCGVPARQVDVMTPLDRISTRIGIKLPPSRIHCHVQCHVGHGVREHLGGRSDASRLKVLIASESCTSRCVHRGRVGRKLQLRLPPPRWPAGQLWLFR